jgi:hypothetical protein
LSKGRRGIVLSPEHRAKLRASLRRTIAGMSDEERRAKYGSRDQNGPKNPAWKGAEAGYAAIHVRNQKAFTPPDEHRCEHCDAPEDGQRHHWAFLRHPERHTEVREDYAYLCAPCHARLDKDLRT